MSEEKSTFSLLLSRLAEIEEKCASFYMNTSTQVKPEFKDFFLLFAQQHEKTKNGIERAKVESLVEFALEPIPDLGINEQLKKVKDLIQEKNNLNIQKVITIEKEISKLIEEISNKIGHMSADASQVLSIAQKRASRRIKVLEHYVKEN